MKIFLLLSLSICLTTFATAQDSVSYEEYIRGEFRNVEDYARSSLSQTISRWRGYIEKELLGNNNVAGEEVFKLRMQCEPATQVGAMISGGFQFETKCTITVDVTKGQLVHLKSDFFTAAYPGNTDTAYGFSTPINDGAAHKDELLLFPSSRYWSNQYWLASIGKRERIEFPDENNQGNQRRILRTRNNYILHISERTEYVKETKEWECAQGQTKRESLSICLKEAHHILSDGDLWADKELRNNRSVDTVTFSYSKKNKTYTATAGIHGRREKQERAEK